jgi:hypothetical protein
MNPRYRRILVVALITFIAIVITVPILLVFPRNFNHLFWSPVCIERAEIEKLQLNAVVISKFKDYSNHNYNTIKFQDISTEATINKYFINEESGFYDFIQVGDTVIKDSNNLEILITNRKVKSRLLYNCDK